MKNDHKTNHDLFDNPENISSHRGADKITPAMRKRGSLKGKTLIRINQNTWVATNDPKPAEHYAQLYNL